VHNHSNQYIWLLFYFISFISLILCLSCHTKFSAFNLQYIYIYIYILMFFLLFFTLIAPRSELPLIFKCFSTTYKLWSFVFCFFGPTWLWSNIILMIQLEFEKWSPMWKDGGRTMSKCWCWKLNMYIYKIVRCVEVHTKKLVETMFWTSSFIFLLECTCK
jgi:hypothetical protein